MCTAFSAWFVKQNRLYYRFPGWIAQEEFAG